MDNVKLKILMTLGGSIVLNLTRHEAEAYLEHIKRSNWVQFDDDLIVNTSHIIKATILSTEI